MTSLTLTAQADIGFLYDALQRRLAPDEWRKLTGGGVMTRELFIAHCRTHNMPSVGFELDGKVIGGMLFDGSAAHIEVLPEYHGRWGALWRPALKWMFAQKDPMQVDIEVGNHKCHRFMAHNNWPRVKQNDQYITYEMSSSTLPAFLRPDKGRAEAHRTSPPA
jgi:hypothetical protein